MSETALTLSTDPMDSVGVRNSTTLLQRSLSSRRQLTSLGHLCTLAGNLNEDNISKVALSVVGDANRSNTGRVVEGDPLVVLRVALSCREVQKGQQGALLAALELPLSDSLTRVRERMREGAATTGEVKRGAADRASVRDA